MRRAVLAIAITAVATGAHASAVGRAGEWITRDDNGAKVCQLAVDISTETTLATSWCTNWQVRAPVWPEQITIDQQHWIQCGGMRAGCILHFENGWRP